VGQELANLLQYCLSIVLGLEDEYHVVRIAYRLVDLFNPIECYISQQRTDHFPLGSSLFRVFGVDSLFQGPEYPDFGAFRGNEFFHNR
jgi:hypothetical protein